MGRHWWVLHPPHVVPKPLKYVVLGVTPGGAAGVSGWHCGKEDVIQDEVPYSFDKIK